MLETELTASRWLDVDDVGVSELFLPCSGHPRRLVGSKHASAGLEAGNHTVMSSLRPAGTSQVAHLLLAARLDWTELVAKNEEDEDGTEEDDVNIMGSLISWLTSW